MNEQPNAPTEFCTLMRAQTLSTDICKIFRPLGIIFPARKLPLYVYARLCTYRVTNVVLTNSRTTFDYCYVSPRNCADFKYLNYVTLHARAVRTLFNCVSYVLCYVTKVT